MDHLTDLQLFRYSLPLARPLNLGTRTIERREGLLLRIRGADGAAGWGDVAPLPGFSGETIDAAARQIVGSRALLLEALSTGRIAEAVRSRGTVPLYELDPMDLFPSVRCGLEQAALMVEAGRTERSVPALLGSGSVDQLPLNCLLTSNSPNDSAAAAADLARQGYRSFKLKVGRGSLSEDIETVRAVSETVGPEDCSLRLDANRAWDFGQAREFCDRVAGCSVEYIEEPLRDPEHLYKLSRYSSHPLALDETIREITPETLEAHKFAGAVVLKPSLQGGFTASARWIEAARTHNMTPVVSSSFESGLGLLGLAWLAAGCGLGTIPAGLDTWRWLTRDVLTPPLTANGAYVTLRSPDDIVIDESRLTPVE